MGINSYGDINHVVVHIGEISMQNYDQILDLPRADNMSTSF